jgi:O-acetyl-ADP-ribose deacetylase (regulator of RNase III)
VLDRIAIVEGDITTQDVDAIVNAANNHLWMGGGVAGAIKKKGGAAIEKEAVAQGPIEVGQAVITEAGSLPTKYVVHAAGMGQDLRTDRSKIDAAVRNSLSLAESKRIKSISFPAIGTGVGRFSHHECARVMLDACIEFLQGSTHLKLIRFVLFDPSLFEIFDNYLRERFSR